MKKVVTIAFVLALVVPTLAILMVCALPSTGGTVVAGTLEAVFGKNVASKSSGLTTREIAEGTAKAEALRAEIEGVKITLATENRSKSGKEMFAGWLSDEAIEQIPGVWKLKDPGKIPTKGLFAGVALFATFVNESGTSVSARATEMDISTGQGWVLYQLKKVDKDREVVYGQTGQLELGGETQEVLEMNFAVAPPEEIALLGKQTTEGSLSK